jgi:hypothetical protein
MRDFLTGGVMDHAAAPLLGIRSLQLPMSPLLDVLG